MHRDLMLGFCSLGRNCEFGFAQRAYDAEPLDLFRWASTRPEPLCRMLRDRFSDIGTPHHLEIYANDGGEYYCKHKKYHFVWHCWAKVGGATPDELLTRERKRLPFLARKLIEDLEDGERVFVMTGPIDTLTVEQSLAVHSEMARYGAPRLMCVTLGDCVAVTQDGPTLLRATVPAFADPAHVPSTTNAPMWLGLCEKARALVTA